MLELKIILVLRLHRQFIFQRPFKRKLSSAARNLSNFMARYDKNK